MELGKMVYSLKRVRQMKAGLTIMTASPSITGEISEDQEVSPSKPSGDEKQASSRSDRYASNVFRLCMFSVGFLELENNLTATATKRDALLSRGPIAITEPQSTPQIVLYQSGVGVPNDFEGNDSTALASATGKAV
ncbi:hypothetical protein FRC09_001076, partial [Ceratobasidium sp. 395]